MAPVAGDNVFIAKVGTDAGIEWVDALPRRSTSGSASYASAAAIDEASGGAAFVGPLYGSLDVGPGTSLIAPSDGGTGFVLHVDANGGSASGWLLPDPDGARPLGVAYDLAGNLVLAGRFAGRLAWCRSEFQSEGGADGFVIALPR